MRAHTGADIWSDIVPVKRDGSASTDSAKTGVEGPYTSLFSETLEGSTPVRWLPKSQLKKAALGIVNRQDK